MKLAYWMYSGPAHLGTLRIASSFQDIHALMHAPLGDDYFHVLRSMLERQKQFTPVTTSIVDRHVLAEGSKEKVHQHLTQKRKEEEPNLLLLTPTCTSSILQEDLQCFVQRAQEESGRNILLADVNHYRLNEHQAADRTLQQIVAYALDKRLRTRTATEKKSWRSEHPSVNILGPVSLGFHQRHDLRELIRLFRDLEIEVNCVIPEKRKLQDLQKLPRAWRNVVPYREIGWMTAQYLKQQLNTPILGTIPMGVTQMTQWMQELAEVLPTQWARKIDSYLQWQLHERSRAAWFARSIDAQNLIRKRRVVFGDATHAASMTKILRREFGLQVVCAGTYCKHDRNWFREELEPYAEEILFTEDHQEITKKLEELRPDVIFGTQMERHVGKRLHIPCGVISPPIHIQNYPMSFRPWVGFEGMNQIADLIYNSLQLGMEEHLLELFGGHDTKRVQTSGVDGLLWEEPREAQLRAIPGFVRQKVKQKTEAYVQEKGFSRISLELFYEAKKALSK